MCDGIFYGGLLLLLSIEILCNKTAKKAFGKYM